jgi:ribose transport system substrate-binding protein
MTKFNASRRNILAAGAGAGLASAFGLPGLSSKALADSHGMEYVFLSIVTQVPFWIDHRNGLKDVAELLGVKTTFTGPLDFDTAAQARQLDELIARRPAGILIFPGDEGAMAPGINRAVEAGIPVATCTGDVPDSARSTFFGINGFNAGKVGGELLAQAIGGKGKVLLGTFPAPSVLQRVEGYKAVFEEKYPEIEVVDVVNDKADPSYAPTAYLQAIQANPDIVGIGGTDGDSGKGAAIAITEAGTIRGAVAQKSYIEAFLAVHLLHWQNTDALSVVPDWRAAGINPLPESVDTGVMTITKDNVAQFKH